MPFGDELRIEDYHLILPNEEVFIKKLDFSELDEVLLNLLKIDPDISNFRSLNRKIKTFLDREKFKSPEAIKKVRKHLALVFQYSQDLNDACYLMNLEYDDREIFRVRIGESGPVHYGSKEDFPQYFDILEPAVEDCKRIMNETRKNEKENTMYFI
jgi:hypothetical protein